MTNEQLNLDNISIAEAVQALYLDPHETLQDIYNKLTDAGIPDCIAIPATKKAFEITRNVVTQTLQRAIENQVNVDGWGV